MTTPHVRALFDVTRGERDQLALVSNCQLGVILNTETLEAVVVKEGGHCIALEDLETSVERLKQMFTEQARPGLRRALQQIREGARRVTLS